MAADKVTSAGVVQEAISKLDAGQVLTLEQLYTMVLAAGIQKELGQVYADVQSLASRRKIGRGAEPRTYCKLEESADPTTRAPKAEGDEAPKQRRIKTGNGGRSYSNEEVTAFIEQELGPAVKRNDTESAFCAVMLQEWPGQFYLDRATMVLTAKPTRWFTFQVGENTALGFYR